MRADLRALLHDQEKGHRPGPGHGQAQRRVVWGHGWLGIRAWKRGPFYHKIPGQDIDAARQKTINNMPSALPPVLVIDDEKNMRLSLKTLLSDEGYEARAVESAEEGLALLAQEDFLMVITDARLGGMSGYDFLAKARAQWPDLPI